MELTEVERLRFRRQYLISPHSIDCPFMHKETLVSNGLILYSHIDLPVCEYCENDIKLFLLGDIFDFNDAKKENKDILKELAICDFDSFLEKFSKYSGRYVLLYIKNDRVIVLHDATATRKVYYCRINNSFWFGSTPYLLAKILDLDTTSDSSKLSFYRSKDFTWLNNSNIGDTTRYDEIRQLIPNHYFDLDKNEPVRYWPDKEIIQKPYKQVAEKCSYMIKGYIQAIASRYDIMIPVTSGKDSRILVAGSRELADEVYYYVNKEASLSRYHPDIHVPYRLFRKLKIKFHMHDIYGEIDKEFRKIFLENNPYASEVYLPHIYHYYRYFQDKVNLPGNIASSWISEFKIDVLNQTEVTPEFLSRIYEIDLYEYALDYYSDWINSSQSLCYQYNVKPVNLFYWEERLANWGSQTQQEKDIAQEDFNPFNSRLLVAEFFSVDYKYMKRPGLIFYKEIIRSLWPELMTVPISPFMLRAVVKSLKLMGIYKCLK